MKKVIVREFMKGKTDFLINYVDIKQVVRLDSEYSQFCIPERKLTDKELQLVNKKFFDKENTVLICDIVKEYINICTSDADYYEDAEQYVLTIEDNKVVQLYLRNDFPVIHVYYHYTGTRYNIMLLDYSEENIFDDVYVNWITIYQTEKYNTSIGKINDKWYIKESNNYKYTFELVEEIKNIDEFIEENKISREIIKDCYNSKTL